jgi:(2R)-ethylmalonyl-CoA mutase
MGRLWTQIGRERYGVEEEKYLRFRYGVQVNSLGLTESQPENNVPRIVVEALAVSLSRDARARAIQLPAWNEALGLPRPWDQQWSLRIQQILAFETDLLEYPDIFEGSKVMEGLVTELTEGARAEMAVVAEHGGAVDAVEYMKARMVESHRERVARIERGDQKVIGQNSYTETEDSPLTRDAEGGILKPDPEVERERIESLELWRAERDDEAVQKALDELSRVASADDENIMLATIEAAKVGVTTGEWAGALRRVFGDYQAPTGITLAAPSADVELLQQTRRRVDEISELLGHRIRILVGKPGLDGHSNGSEQIALRARDVGMEVIYQGIRLTPEQIANSAIEEDVDVVGLSILSGSHLQLIPEVVRLLREGGSDVPVVVGGIIPAGDEPALREAGVAGVYTPKDFDINRIMGDIVELVAERAAAASPA